MVEQQVLSNDLLTDLSARMGTGGIGQAASWIGMEARSVAPVEFDGNPITLVPPPAVSAQSSMLIVQNARGIEIQRRPTNGTGAPIEWTGKSNDGSPLPNGEYKFLIEHISADGTTQTKPVESYARVVEARLDVTGPKLILKGGHEVTVDQIRALREPT